jgi:class 3 adenylate cyclase/tetratricopeptide (TPR) repeat protein
VSLTDDERTSTLASYVPRTVLRRLSMGPAASEPGAERFPAALLMIDITGFTPITDAAVRRGPAGTEQLSRSLNSYLGSVIDLVEAHGGDIAKVVGDALIPVWPASDGDLPAAARRAASCGLAIVSELGEARMEADLRLSLKVGLCAGRLSATHVGGLGGRWLFLITGEAVSQLVQLQPLLGTGDLVASPQAWALVSDRFLGQPQGYGHVRLTAAPEALPPRAAPPVVLSPAQEAAARAYIPPILLSRLDAGQAEWLAELRRTTVIFTNVDMADAGPDPLPTLQQVTVAAQRVLSRYDGWLKEITMDDKGTTLISVFGVPPFTHEDDPARAVASALSLQAELHGLGLASGTGVATGPTFCGPVGNARRRDFAMLGGHVNLAARLMQAAGPDAILCDSATRLEAQGRHDFERRPAYVLKGLATPIDVYLARPVSPAGDRLSSLIDRTEEMAIAAGLLGSLQAGSGALIRLEGEPGIGKSRLVDEWLRGARDLGVTALTGAASEIDVSTPYHAWRQVFERLLGVEAVTEPGARRALVLERLRSDPQGTRLAPLLAQVLSLDLPDNETTSQLVGAVRADNTGDLLIRLLRRVAGEGPVMVVLEDAHWFDSASWGLVHRARREVPELLLVVTTRPVASVHPASAPSLEPGSKQVRLGVLSHQDAVALAAQRTGASRLAEAVATVVQERAEGNPLFVEQLTYALRDAGQIVVDHGLLRTASGLGDLERSIIPDTVQRVITSRIDQLPPAVAMTLKVASVIGTRFALRTLAEIHPLAGEADVLRDHLDALTRLDLVAPAEPASEPTYEFRHKVTQEVAYNLMPSAQSRQLHLALGEWYEGAYPEPSPFHALLAHHWERAGRPDRAVHHLDLAGAQALRTFANEEAIGFLGQALSLAAAAGGEVETKRSARRHLELGESYVHVSRYREGRGHLETGLRLMHRAPPAGRWRQGASLLGQTFRQVLHRIGLARSSGHLSEEQRDDLVAVCRAYERLAEASYYGRETLLPLYSVIRILNEAETSGSAPEIARGLAGTGALFGLVPLPRIAEGYLGRALARLEQVDDLTTHEIVGIVVGFYYAGAGRWQQAQEQFTTVRGIAHRLGDRRRLLDAVGNLTEIEYLRGSSRVAAELADELLGIARALGDRRFEAEALAVRAWCDWELRRPEDAQRSLTTLRSIAAEEIDLPDELRIKLQGIEAVIHLARGDAAAAMAAAAEALRLTSAQRPTYGTFLGHVGPAEVYLDLWEAGHPALPDARARSTEALRSLAAYARIFPVGRPRQATLEGRRSWLLGRHAAALRRWRAALVLAKDIGMPSEAALAHFEIGRHLGTGDAEGATHLRAARDAFEGLGAARALAKVEEAAGGMPTPAQAR